VIVEWFVGFATGLLGVLADALPTVELPSEAGGALSWVMTMNGVAPVAGSLAVAALALVVLAMLFLYRVIKIVVSHIPLVGGSG